MGLREDVRCTRLGVQICRVRGQTAVDQVIAQQPNFSIGETMPPVAAGCSRLGIPAARASIGA